MVSDEAGILKEEIKDIGLLGLDYIGGRNHWIRGTSLLSLTILTSLCGLLLAPKESEASARAFYLVQPSKWLL